jgi:hypothetical protein
MEILSLLLKKAGFYLPKSQTPWGCSGCLYDFILETALFFLNDFYKFLNDF